MIWDERYSDPEFVYGTKPNDFLASLQLTADGQKKVLCLAEGEGRNAVYLAKQGFKVLAVDQSMQGLKKALKLAEQNKVSIEIEQANLSTYQIPENTYDGIISIFGHFDPATRQYIHSQAMHGLKKQGFFVMEAYSKDQLNFKTGGPSDPEMLYDLKDLELDFADQLEFIIHRKIVRDVVEGKYHTGKASVNQIFGIKK